MGNLTNETIEWLRPRSVSCSESEFQSALTELWSVRTRIKQLEERLTDTNRTPVPVLSAEEREALATELRDLRSMKTRLEAWADQLETSNNGTGDDPFIGVETPQPHEGSMTMADLTDEELALFTCDGECECIFCRAGLEIRRHRATQRADAERVRSVVHAAAVGAWPYGLTTGSMQDATANAIADRAAEQLTTAAVELSAGDREAIASWREHAIYRRLANQPAIDAIDRLLAALPDDDLRAEPSDFDADDIAALAWLRDFVNQHTEPYDDKAGAALGLIDRFIARDPTGFRSAILTIADDDDLTAGALREQLKQLAAGAAPPRALSTEDRRVLAQLAESGLRTTSAEREALRRVLGVVP